MDIFTIYDHPRDFPNDYVARRWVLMSQTTDYYAHPDLEKVRDWVQARLHEKGIEGTRLDRSPEDDLCILECWV